MAGNSRGQIEFEVISLKSLESSAVSEFQERVKASLRGFECALSPHLEKFARESVWRFERHGNSKTYVVVTGAENTSLDVAAFFTVGLTSIDFRKMTKSASRRIMGDVSLSISGAFMIADLARSDRYSADQLPGIVILEEAKRAIAHAHSIVGGRYVVVDTQPQVFEKLYKPAGFKMLHPTSAPLGMENSNFITAGCLVRDW